MLNALYVVRTKDGAEFQRTVTTALRSARVRRVAAAQAVANTKRSETPDLIVARLEAHEALNGIADLRQAFPKSLIVVASRGFSQERSAAVYRAGANTFVPLNAVGDAIANLARVFEADERRPSGPDETMVEEFHDPTTGRLDANAVARGLGISVSGLAKAVGLTPSALSKRPRAKSAQDALREIEFAMSGLRRLLGADSRVRAWLNAPHPDLEGDAPLALLRTGSAKDLADYVRGALSGQST